MLPNFEQQLEDRGFFSNFRQAAGLEPVDPDGPKGDAYAHTFLEGLGHVLAAHPNADDMARLEQYAIEFAGAQEDDGYLYTSRTLGKTGSAMGYDRWLNELGAQTGHDSHETYNMGHFIEATIAHASATGSDTFLTAGQHSADLIKQVWMEDGLTIPPGHPHIEMTLGRLYRATGEEKYLDLMRHLMEARGRGHPNSVWRSSSYYCNHAPVTNMTLVAGHAVRASYLYTGMADYALLTGDEAYRHASTNLWRNLVLTRLYLTGGIGSVASTEGFGPAYSLPNDGYAETCGAVANIMWHHRLVLLEEDGKFTDVLERVLYNALPAGFSLDGSAFFYRNPLEDLPGTRQRTEWQHTPCCLGNLARYVPQIPGLIYSVRESILYTHLYMAGEATIEIGDTNVLIRQETDYPWDGEVALTIEGDAPVAFELRLRIPGWARGAPMPGTLYTYRDPAPEAWSVSVNGVPQATTVERGYVRLNRVWQPGDVVNVDLPMMPRRVQAHPNVADVAGRIAVERGPVVYCVEAIDHDGALPALSDTATLHAHHEPALLGGVTVVTADAETPVTLIPYAVWNNRGPSRMQVWLGREAGDTHEYDFSPRPTLRYRFDEAESGTMAAMDTGTGDPADAYFADNATRTSNTPSADSLAALSTSGGDEHNYAYTARPAKLDEMQAFTLSMWINLHSDPALYDRLISMHGHAGNGFDWYFTGESTRTSFNTQLEVNSAAAAGSESISVPTGWTFLAVTYDGTRTSDNVLFYVGTETNEVQQHGTPRTANAGALFSTSTDLRVAGTTRTSNNRTPDAWFDDVRVYDHVLTMGQLQAVRRGGAGIPAAISSVAEFEKDTQGLQLGTLGTDGAIYILQETTNLTESSSWRNVRTNLATGGRADFGGVATTNAPHQFFRIIAP